MKSLKENELKTLYWNFVAYRDNICNGHADMSVESFYNKFGLNPWTK